MIGTMRTTLIIDDSLFHQAKTRAAEAHLTLSELVSRALRDALRPSVSEAPPPPYQPLTFGGAPESLGMEPADLAALAEAEDLAALNRW